MRTLTFLAIVALGLGTTQIAHADPGSLLIRNVWLILPGDQTSEDLVHLLIEDGVLTLVTQDTIPATEVDQAFDAEEGFLLGELTVGERTGFLITNQDPRQDIRTLMDTEAHIRFVMREGRILRNELNPVAPEVLAERPQRSRWLAYSPPPMAIPLSYQDETKWNRFETGPISGIFLAALVLDRQRWLSQDDTSKQQVGDLDAFNGGEIRGFRMGAIGTLNFETPWVYSFFLATHAFDKGFDPQESDKVTLFDYRLDIPLPRNLTLSIGKQKEPISMERIMSLAFWPLQERSTVSDGMLPSRNVGLLINGGGFVRRMTWAGGLFNNWFDEGQALEKSATQVAGRLTGLPYASEHDFRVLHAGAGFRYTDAKEGVRFGTEAEFNQSPLFVDTGLLTAENAWTLNLELGWKSGPLWVMGEYLQTAVSAPALEDPTFVGYHATASWVLTGETRPYHRQAGIFRPVPVSRSVEEGGWGAWEVAARWSDLNLNAGTVEGGRVQVFSLGLNGWLTPTFNVGINYRNTWLRKDGSRGSANGFNTRLLLSLE